MAHSLFTSLAYLVNPVTQALEPVENTDKQENDKVIGLIE